MATVTVSGSIDPNLLSLAALVNGSDIDVTEQRSTAYAFSFGGASLRLTGGGLRYLDDVPTSGSITGLVLTFQGASVTITDLSIDVADTVRRLLAGDASALGPDLFYGGNDLLEGGALSDVIRDLTGHNVIKGGDGADTLIGGSGNDHIYGQSANGGPDGADSIDAGAGSDYVQGNAGSDTIDGGDGSDRIQGGADGDRLLGSAGNDTVNGNRGNDSIFGGAGNDSLRGGQDDDAIDGGDGDDILSGDLGADMLTGGAGSDIFVFTATSSAIGAQIDGVADYVIGSDHLALGFAPQALLTGSAASADAARTAAQALFDGHAGSGEVAAIAVGSATYVFWGGTGGGMIDSVVSITGHVPGDFTLQDFI